jgi:hypothetical protein
VYKCVSTLLAAPPAVSPLQVKLLKCLVDNIVVDISFNQLGGLFTLNFLEEMDMQIGSNHLFKRSIILVRVEGAAAAAAGEAAAAATAGEAAAAAAAGEGAAAAAIAASLGITTSSSTSSIGQQRQQRNSSRPGSVLREWLGASL